MLLTGLERFNEFERTKIQQAYDLAKELHAGQFRITGEPYFMHPVGVAQILIDAGKDYQTICASLLHDTIEDTRITYEELKEIFDTEIADIIEGVTKANVFAHANKEDITLATDRKILQYLIKDIRVIDVKLADRVHNMQTASAWTLETQQRKARENLSLYAPLAKSIGAYRIKKILEDSSFEILNPYQYKLITGMRDVIKRNYGSDIENAKDIVQLSLINENIFPEEIKIQYKNVYEIFASLKGNVNEMLQLDDLINMKIIVKNIPTCYQTLGIVNEIYRPKDVIDYIGNPKPNRYQSLHSVITYKTNKDALVKIRTKAMDLKATYGVSYQEYSTMGGQKLFQGLAEVDNTYRDDKEFLNHAKEVLFGEKITVFSKTGERYELAKGATVVDFAFYEGSGLNEYQAMVNGKPAPENYVLQNGDAISIHISKKERKLNEAYCSNAKTFYATQILQRKLSTEK